MEPKIKELLKRKMKDAKLSTCKFVLEASEIGKKRFIRKVVCIHWTTILHVCASHQFASSSSARRFSPRASRPTSDIVVVVRGERLKRLIV